MMEIPAGTTCYIGPPAKPIPKQTSDAIGTALGKIPEIVEAYLPMIFAEGHIDPPAQVLVVVLDGKGPSPQARVSEALRAVLPTNSHMDVMESDPSDPKLATIRATGTQLNLNRKLH
jgi:SseB protein C-terminal domain